MEYAASIIDLALIYGMVAIAQNLVVGHSGQFTIAQGAFFGVGAYAYALGTGAGLSIIMSLLIGCAIASILAAILSYIGRQLTGDYFMIVTLAFQIIAVAVVANLEVTGGTAGLFGLQSLSIAGYEPQRYSEWSIILLCIFILFWIFYTLIEASRFGLICKALRSDELAARSLGRFTFLYRMSAFALASAGTGLAGGVYASFATFISPSQFTFLFSILIISILIVGGIANPLGPVIGAVLLVGLPETLRFVPMLPDEVRARALQLLYAVALLGFVALRPEGIIPEWKGRWSMVSWRHSWQRHAHGRNADKLGSEKALPHEPSRARDEDEVQ